jgi:hypothetical protein
MMRLAISCPRTSSRACPKVASAAGLKSTIWPWWSMVMMQSSAASSIPALRASLSRRGASARLSNAALNQSSVAKMAMLAVTNSDSPTSVPYSPAR